MPTLTRSSTSGSNRLAWLWLLQIWLLHSVAISARPGTDGMNDGGDGAKTIQQRGEQQLPVTVLFQFPEPGVWIENLAVLGDGSGDVVFTTVMPNASVYRVHMERKKGGIIGGGDEYGHGEVGGSSGMGAELELLYTFAGLDSLTGVVAGTGKKRDGDGDGEDTLLVLGGNITGPGAGVPGSWAVWQVAGFGSSNLDGGTGRGLASTSTATKVADIPGDVFPNGIALLPNDDNVVLISDSKNGALLRLDRAANRLDTILCAPEMAPVLGAKPAIGINGLKIRDGWAYWGNSFASTIYRSCLNSTGFHCANGSRKAERVAEVPGTWLDDFAFGSDDIIWAATNVNNTVVAIDAAQNRSEVVAGATDSLELAGVTAVDFGRRAGERTLLFFSTSGGLAYPVNGSIVEPGKVGIIDTARWMGI